MNTTLDERTKFLQKCLHDCESYVFIGPENGTGKRFVTKIMKLKDPGIFKTTYREEQVARNFLWLGLQKKNKNLAKIHHLRGIEIDGKPGLLIIQEHADGTQNSDDPIDLDPNTFKYLDDVRFKPERKSNIIRTKNGLKVVDAYVHERVMAKQKEKCPFPPGKCNCDWHAVVRKTADGSGPLPDGYIFPQEIKKAYDPKANPWISQMERETKQMNRNRTNR